MSAPERGDGPAPRPDGSRPSWGNISERHWSRARKGENREALEYYKQRSQAPGVREGGAERNFYCMECDGVIPHATQADACPHCGAALDDKVRRYFNWVELDEPTRSDARALLPFALAGLGLVLVVVLALVWWLA